MAELKIDGRMKVKTLKANFKSNFGSTLRVYKRLASLRAEGAKGGELTVGGNKTVGKFEEEFAATWGIGVQVASADDSKLADNKATLVAAGK